MSWPVFSVAVAMSLCLADAAGVSAEREQPAVSLSDASQVFSATAADFTHVPEWVGAVWEHQPGVADGAARRVAAQPARDLIPTLNAVRCLTQMWVAIHEESPEHSTSKSVPQTCGRVLSTTALDDMLAMTGPGRTNVSQLLLRGVLLHTDIALLMLPTAAGLTGGNDVIAVQDGVSGTASNTSLHWDSSRSILGWLAPPLRDDAGTRWYRAVVASLEQESRLGEAMPNIERGLGALPHDPRLEFFGAALHESFAGTRVQNTVAAARVPNGMSLGIFPAKQELGVAVPLLERVLAAEPANAEVRLHYGHVLDQLGRHDEAVRELERAAATLPDADLQYDAAMFLGRAKTTLGRYAEADAAFSRARTLFPRAQSARIALSHSAQHVNDSARAVSEIRAPLEWMGRNIDDPWTRYDVSHVRDAAAALDNLRAFLAGGRGKGLPSP